MRGSDLKPSAVKVLRLLRRAGDHGITTGQFREEGVGTIAERLAELRRAGHRINSERIPGSHTHRYFLKASERLRSDSEGVRSTHADSPEGSGRGAPHSPRAPRPASGSTLVFQFDTTKSVSKPLVTVFWETPARKFDEQLEMEAA